ncbi:MAG: hypothetical protein U1E61_14055 [Bradyrhizobium sp.]
MMTGTALVVIIGLLFLKALAYSLLPGLIIGFPIGLLVQSRDFLSMMWSGICSALLLTTLFGQWLGRKWGRPADSASPI